VTPSPSTTRPRRACNVWDEAALRKWDIKGPDVIALADALFTNDMAALEVYGALCDEQGLMVMDGTIFKFADDHCFSITSYDSDLDHFREVASDRGLDVQVQDVTDDMPHLQVQGPLAREVLGAITEGVDVATLRYFRFVPEGVTVGGVPIMLSRTGYSGELGFELYCSPGDAAELLGITGYGYGWDKTRTGLLVLLAAFLLYVYRHVVQDKIPLTPRSSQRGRSAMACR
jgi:aminomethyltransferase